MSIEAWNIKQTKTQVSALIITHFTIFYREDQEDHDEDLEGDDHQDHDEDQEDQEGHDEDLEEEDQEDQEEEEEEEPY